MISPTTTRKWQNSRMCTPGVLSLTGADDIEQDTEGPWAGWKGLPSHAPATHITPDWNNARADLYRYQECRRQILDTTKRLERLRYHALRNDNLDWENGRAAQQQKLERLFGLQEAEAQCRSSLSETKLERVLIEGIDRLIDGSTAHKGRQALPLKITDPMPYSSVHEDQISVLRSMSSHGSMADYDTRLPIFAARVLEEIDTKIFASNFNCFLNVEMRLPRNASLICDAKEGQGAPTSAIQPLDLLHDNLLHAGAFFTILKSEASAERSVKAHVERIWRRLMAVLAICYGCTSEPAFFLSIADHLLNELKGAFGTY